MIAVKEVVRGVILGASRGVRKGWGVYTEYDTSGMLRSSKLLFPTWTVLRLKRDMSTESFEARDDVWSHDNMMDRQSYYRTSMEVEVILLEA